MATTVRPIYVLRPRADVHLAGSNLVHVEFGRHQPAGGPLAAKTGRSIWAMLLPWVLFALGFSLLGCSRDAEPPRREPDVPALMSALDRIEGGIVVHEIAVRDWRLAR